MQRGDQRQGERGHLMAGLMAAVTIMMIFSGIAFQEWSEVLRRDNEAEMIFRAQDLVRAIQRYRLDHGGQGPLKLDLLMEPGPKGQYYARRLWKDPLVKDGKWGLLYVGPGNQVVDPTSETGVPGLPGNESGQPATGLGGLNNRPIGPRANSRAGRQRAEQQQDASGFGNSVGNRTGSLSGDEGELGLPIAGVKSLCDEAPFRYYRGLTEYSQWLFTYFDLEQPGQPGAPGQGGAAGQGPGGDQPIGGGRPGIGGTPGAGGRPGAGQGPRGKAPGFGKGKGKRPGFGGGNGP